MYFNVQSVDRFELFFRNFCVFHFFVSETFWFQPPLECDPSYDFRTLSEIIMKGLTWG